MGTINFNLGAPHLRHHPALGVGTYHPEPGVWDLDQDALTRYATNSLSWRWHVDVEELVNLSRQATGHFNVLFFYAARGSWRSDIVKRGERVKLDEDTLCGFSRHVLCPCESVVEHKQATCPIDDDWANSLCSEALRLVRADPMWRPTEEWRLQSRGPIGPIPCLEDPPVYITKRAGKRPT